MKINFVIIVLLALSFCRLTAQNIEPAQQPVNYCGNPNYVIQSTSPQFTQDTVFTGWMWGSKPLISNALYVNQNDIAGEDYFKYITKDANLIVRTTLHGGMYCNHGGGTNMLLARAMHYKTTLTIPLTNINYDSIADACNGNNNNSVFGWRYINPSTTTNGNSLVLDKTNSAICGQVILQEPWKIERLQKNSLLSKPQIIFAKNEKKPCFDSYK